MGNLCEQEIGYIIGTCVLILHTVFDKASVVYPGCGMVVTG